MKRLQFLLALFLAPFAVQAADEKAAAVPASKQFIYVLHLTPRLHDDNAWTDADKAVIAKHVAHLKAGTDSGKIVLAGRTMESGDKTFGIVIFTAEDETAAAAFMNSDPCVEAKIMRAEVHPFAVVFKGK